ncbi:MoxR family ATPase [Aurantimonas sp. 22II-16-19i]|uniref:AAA family ATPase n=1 Tax=Aurantimonas sp. 22II-16-19i TaxID=1317114 RepID=UPI0009F7D93E|nr:MoxR family ATPase [Aurantimonas sp. 22II-16-19i]ORE96921.1 MoxR family protein [Aurantimonas sp. 22II-16-19i]
MTILTPQESTLSDSAIVGLAEAALADIARVRESVGRVIFGQESVVEQTVIAILGGGHALLVGVPGLAKTKLVDTLGVAMGLDARRIQFTPDLMPSDIIGTEVMDQDETGRRSFRYVKGPVFAQLLMADEINRASPRTQSALLQAMQEYHVTVAGERYDLPAPFHVLATQNPLEQEGTYPLPEAQLDRFLMQVDVHYPDLASERRILLETGGSEDHAEPVLGAERLREIQMLVRRMPVPDSVVDAILNLVRSARPGSGHKEADTHIAWGPGPRASQSLMTCVRARALYEGRLAPSIDDVMALAEPILQHRMALNFAARAEGMSVRDVIAALKRDVA